MRRGPCRTRVRTRARWRGWRLPVLPRRPGALAVRAAVFITVMCCALAALLGVLVHVSVTQQTVDEARDAALAHLAEATAAYQAGDSPVAGAQVDPPGLPASLRALAVGGARGTMVARYEGRPTMWAAGPVDGGRALAVGIDYSQQARTIDGLDRAILWSSALAIGATVLVGAFAVTRVTRRLHTTARVARRISAGDLDARVDDPRARRDAAREAGRPQDEVAAVAAALDSMAASLQAKLLAEQRFTADVAHELRTPLTGLHAAAELLPPGRPTELVRDRVAALRTLTEHLLEISRLDTGRERLEADSERLGPLVERMVRASGRDARVTVVRDAVVETDRRRLERVLGNLVANALRHGRAPVSVTVDGAVVVVRDHGDGYPDYLLTHGPQRFRTEGGTKGHGLGLTIALGQAEVLGARLAFTNAPGGGAVATLALPGGETADVTGGDGGESLGGSPGESRAGGRGGGRVPGASGRPGPRGSSSPAVIPSPAVVRSPAPAPSASAAPDFSPGPSPSADSAGGPPLGRAGGPTGPRAGQAD